MQRIFSKIINIKPASLSILIQTIALTVVFLICGISQYIALEFFSIELMIPLIVLVFIHATLSMLIAQVMHMANWWRWIHFCFPITIWLMFQLHIPSTFYLAGFILTLSLYWTTFRSQVPFFPSGPRVWEQVTRLIPHDKMIRMVDIGSGLGDMSMYVAEARPNSIVEGIEIAPLPWLVSFVRAKLRRNRARFRMGNYHDLHFADYDVIFAYLSPVAMPDLWQKAQSEMRQGSLLISYEFDIDNVTPEQVIEHEHDKKSLYVWRINK